MYAIAVLFSGDPVTGETTMDVFREGECGERDGRPIDPIWAAELLRRSCEGDFAPSRMWSVTGNEAARVLMSQRRMRHLLGDEAVDVSA